MKVNQTVAIIGLGAEGSWWKRFLETLGHKVLVSDSSSTNQSVVNDANVIVVCVPMSLAVDVICDLVFREDQLIISAVGEMMSVRNALDDVSCEWVQIHRMCGPQVLTMRGQNILLGERFLEKWGAWFEMLLRNTMGTVTYLSNKVHDQQMSITQCLMRLVAIAVLLAIQKLGINLEDTEASSSPPFRLMMAVVGRILKQGNRLCFDMLSSNSYSLGAIGAMEDALHKIRLTILEKDHEGFGGMFESVSETFGKDRIAHSSALVDCIIDEGLDS